MTKLTQAVAALLSAASLSLCAGPASAAAGLRCNAVAATSDGMRIEFHNTSSAEIPAGAKAHWRLRGLAQGDVSLDEALVPGGSVTQDYIFENGETTQGAACSVDTVS